MALSGLSVDLKISSSANVIISLTLNGVVDPSTLSSHAIKCTIVTNVNICLIKIMIISSMCSKYSTLARVVATVNCACEMSLLKQR